MKSNHPSMANTIVAACAFVNNITIEEILGPDRHKICSHPRQDAMFLLRQKTNLSTQNVAKRLNRTDHSTAIEATHVVERRLIKNPLYQNRINKAASLANKIVSTSSNILSINAAYRKMEEMYNMR